MESSSWSPFDQQFSNGSPHLVPPEDSLNNYGATPTNSLLLSCQGMPISRTNVDTVTASSGISNSDIENLISQTIQSSKEDFFNDVLYNGICKENQTGGHNFLQAQGPAPRTEAFPPSESAPGFSSQISSQSFHSTNVELPVSGSFGVLPHESVKSHPGRFERNNTDQFISKQPSVSYNNGPYTDRDVSSSYSSAPHSAQSAFSGDTPSPVVNSVASPSLSNFSSPSDYYSSPKTNNYGAYNTLQSPVPQSPSVAQSYPSSPFASVEPVTHISSGPPCSPMSGGTYMNAVPQRNGHKTQHSPNNNTNMCYNTSQSQNMGYHGPPQSVLQKPADYHSDYSVFAQDQSSSYSSVYPTMHPGQMPNNNNSRISPRTHTTHSSSMSHDGRLSYGHSNAMTQQVSSPTYLQNKINHETSYRTCSSNIPTGQSMNHHTQNYCNPMRNNVHSNPSSIMPDHLGNDRQYDFSSEFADNKNALDIFNSHVDSGIHSDDATIAPYLENDLHLLDPKEVMTAGRQLRSSESDETKQNCAINAETPIRTMVPRPPVPKDPQKEVRSLGTLNYSYSSSHLDPVRPGNFSLNPTRRRGRRGRRRKIDMNLNSGNMTQFQSYKSDRNIYSNGYPLQPSGMLDYRNVDYYSAYNKRICDQKELPPVNYTPMYRSEISVNQNKNYSDVLPKPIKIYKSIDEELSFLSDLDFPSEEEERDSPPTHMKTRNKDSEGFLQCYKKFITSQKYMPNSDVEIVHEKNKSKHSAHNKEHKSKHKKGNQNNNNNSNDPKKLVLHLVKKNQWRIEGSVPPPPLSPPVIISDDESASNISGDEMCSSHVIENDAESKRLRHSNKLNYSKQGAPKRTKSIEIKETNSDNTIAGDIKIKTEVESAPESDTPISYSPKKRGRKSKKALKRRKRSKSTADVASFVPVKIKQEVIEDEDQTSETSRRTLRSRRSETSSSLETGPGPSSTIDKIEVNKDPIGISSDEDIELLDDSDSDPAWTPSVKTPKASDHVMQVGPKKRGPRPRNNAAGPRIKKERADHPRKRRNSSQNSKKESAVIDSSIKAKRNKERFLVAKADMDKKFPYLWRLDKETNMLQRFEWYEQEGIILYRSTYTYAAWNELSFSNYVTANVRIVSHSRMLFVVEYLGPEKSEMDENPTVPVPEAEVPSTNPLRENFEVFLQTLISQALDPNFLTEITNENDEYFLNNIKEIENISEEKKKLLIKDNWDETLIKSMNAYPSVKVLDCADSTSDSGECEICKQGSKTKLLQLSGDAYDPITLAAVELPSFLKNQYDVCEGCSVTLALYSHLQHHKYNFFIKCRTKMNAVKGTLEKMESHVLLEECLQDHTWVNALYDELELMWKQCEEKS